MLLAALREENADLRARLLEGELPPSIVAVAIQSINADIRSLSVSLAARDQEEIVARMERLEGLLADGARRYG